MLVESHQVGICEAMVGRAAISQRLVAYRAALRLAVRCCTRHAQVHMRASVEGSWLCAQHPSVADGGTRPRGAHAQHLRSSDLATLLGCSCLAVIGVSAPRMRDGKLGVVEVTARLQALLCFEGGIRSKLLNLTMCKLGVAGLCRLPTLAVSASVRLLQREFAVYQGL